MGIFMLASGCANLPDPSDPEAVAVYMQVNDPIEPTNRTVFALNNNLDKAILKPVAEAYSVQYQMRRSWGYIMRLIICERRSFC